MHRSKTGLSKHSVLDHFWTKFLNGINGTASLFSVWERCFPSESCECHFCISHCFLSAQGSQKLPMSSLFRNVEHLLSRFSFLRPDIWIFFSVARQTRVTSVQQKRGTDLIRTNSYVIMNGAWVGLTASDKIRSMSTRVFRMTTMAKVSGWMVFLERKGVSR